jgi:putative heme iron utilization protein
LTQEPSQKDVLRPLDAEAVRLARTLLRCARHGALAALDPRDGAPLASLVATATDADGAPLILTSALSAHTSAIEADPRCSLLLGEPGKGDPLAHPRLSIACRARRLERDEPPRERARRRFLATHPKSKLYEGFADFAYFRLEPACASLNGGFGKAYRLDAADLILAGPAVEALADVEESERARLNAESPDAPEILARAFAGARPGRWAVAGIDVEGLDLACGDEARRVFFPQRLADAGALRGDVEAMIREGRERLASAAPAP